MTIHITRFVDRLAGAEARRMKDFVMPLEDAKALHQDITRLLLKLEEYHLQTQAIAESYNEEITEIRISGGNYK